MSNDYAEKKSSLPQLPSALTEFVPPLFSKAVRLNLSLNFAPPSEFPDS